MNLTLDFFYIKINLASRFAYPSVRHEVTLSEDAMLPLAHSNQEESYLVLIGRFEAHYLLNFVAKPAPAYGVWLTYSINEFKSVLAT